MSHRSCQVSLVVCTRNRAAQLARCLDRIAALQSEVDWELVVVDNDSSDGTSGLLAEFARTASFPIRLVVEPVPGLGRARNSGWHAASGRYIAFTDDDCYVASDFIDQVARAFTDPALGYAGGRIKLFDPSDYPITIRDDDDTCDYPAGRYLAPGAIQGANMLFRRTMLTAIGGFDPDMGAGTPFCCEDVDACARASFAGWLGRYLPPVTVWHHHGRKANDVPALARNYALARGAYMMKFILRRDTRWHYLRVWRWRMMRGLREPAQRLACLQEIAGAIKYVWHRL